MVDVLCDLVEVMFVDEFEDHHSRHLLHPEAKQSYQEQSLKRTLMR
jgi:hypothetical protein